MKTALLAAAIILGLLSRYAASAEEMNEVMTYSTHSRPRAGQNFDAMEQHMRNYLILKGDIAGASHVGEYMFRIKHQGTLENLNAAYVAYGAGDLTGAAKLLARGDAFVLDGTVTKFQVIGNRIIAQHFTEDTNQKLGSSFEITAYSILGAVNQFSYPRAGIVR